LVALQIGAIRTYSEPIVVTSTADTGAGTLRHAISQANATAGRDSIYFAIPGPGPHTIQPHSSLDAIFDQVLIDGYSQPGAIPATDSCSAVLRIEVDGTYINDGSFGMLRVVSDSCLIRGVTINRFAESGIQIVPNGGTARHNVIEGCYLGTDIEGTRPLGNAFAGVEVYFADSNLVGGIESSSRNVISGNAWGVFIWGGYDNVVIGNLIGTDALGVDDLGNSYSGVALSIAWENTIGGSCDGSRNVISGNDWRGIDFYDSDRNLVVGNYIGTDITGQLCIENGEAGIKLSLSSENTIGGTFECSKNVISCSGSGISFDGSHQNVILGNFIGTDACGVRALGNSDAGVLIANSNDNTVGGAAVASRNVISGNSKGVRIDSGSDNVILGNFIGTDATGTSDLGNSGTGVGIQWGVRNTIGGTIQGSCNIIAGNGTGISMAWTGQNIVQGNYIGTDVSGAVGIGHSGSGIWLYESSGNTIGGAVEGAGNVIAASGEHGIEHHCIQSSGENNRILGNYIGTDANGTTALPNMGSGISLGQYAFSHTIGGTTPGAGNVIAGNAEHGIDLHDPMGLTDVLGNRIGVSADGMPLGNGGHGILIVPPAMQNTIGGTGDGAGNIIAYNGGAGICVDPGGPNVFLSNAIYSNDSLGIDIGNDGVTPIDPSDNVQDYPVLTSVVSSAGHTTIQGILQGAPSTDYYLEFFSNTEPDPSTYGEGEFFLGFTSVSTDASGEAEFIVTLPASLSGGMYVSATTTDLGYASSEFSQVAFVTTLAGDIMAGQLALWWTPVPGVAHYWLYGAANASYFEPGLSSPYENRLAILPPGTTAWGSSSGIGNPFDNWTYLVLAVDGSNQEISRTNRFGEFDFSTPSQ
jgi:titin